MNIYTHIDETNVHRLKLCLAVYITTSYIQQVPRQYLVDVLISAGQCDIRRVHARPRLVAGGRWVGCGA